MIEARKITVKAGKQILLEDVSLSVNAGEIVAVVGANGAGKSTLLKSLAGEIKTAGGEISFGGKDLKKWREADLAKIRGVLPQNFAVNFGFTGREVVLLSRTPHVKIAETRRDFEIVRAALETVEAAHLAERFYPNLSGGEKQRVHLARVLAQIWETTGGATRYLLLDEPTASLDLQHQHLTLQTARKFADEQTAVLCVLHDLNLAAHYAHKILVLQNGRAFACGAPREVLTTQTIRRVFGVEAIVTTHPKFDAPLIVPLGQTNERAFAAKI